MALSVNPLSISRRPSSRYAVRYLYSETKYTNAFPILPFHGYFACIFLHPFFQLFPLWKSLLLSKQILFFRGFIFDVFFQLVILKFKIGLKVHNSPLINISGFGLSNLLFLSEKKCADHY